MLNNRSVNYYVTNIRTLTNFSDTETENCSDTKPETTKCIDKLHIQVDDA
jgi:hypothetical protein